MKNTLMLCLLALAISACSTIRAPIDPKAEISDTICKQAAEYVAQGQAEASKKKSDKVLEIGLDACGALGDQSLGYLIYHIDVWALTDHKYLGHVKRMSLYEFKDGKWQITEEGTIVFVSPKESATAAPDDEFAPKVYKL